MQVEIRQMLIADLDAWSRMRACLWDSLDLDGHRSEIATMVGSARHRAYLAFGRNGEAYGFAELSIRDYANGCTQTPGAISGRDLGRTRSEASRGRSGASYPYRV